MLAMSTEHLPRLPEQLTEALRLPTVDALRKSLKRWGIIDGRFDRTKPLSLDQMMDVAKNYSEKGSEDTQEAAAKLVDQLIAELPNSDNGPAPSISSDPRDYTPSGTVLGFEPSDRTQEPDAERPVDEVEADHDGLLGMIDRTDVLPVVSVTDWREVAKDLLLSAVALVAMLVQIVNTATVVQSAEQADGTMALVHSWAFAVAVQFTGLALTLYKGRLRYLQLFALAEFGINLLYFRPWSGGGWESWVTAILLSALIAFTIYSYVEIFAARRTHKTDADGTAG